MKMLLLSDLAIPLSSFLRLHFLELEGHSQSLTVHSRLRSPFWGMMTESLLLSFSCNKHKKLWVRKWIAFLFLFFLFHIKGFDFLISGTCLGN